MEEERIPDDPLGFIKNCVAERKIIWTYHVHMRLRNRAISRRVITESITTYEIIEEYPETYHLPCFLVRLEREGEVFHTLFAVDVGGGNVRVITAYRPDRVQWSEDFRRRK